MYIRVPIYIHHWTWEAATPQERAAWVRFHCDYFGPEITKRLFLISGWALTNICHGGEWLPEYEN